MRTTRSQLEQMFKRSFLLMMENRFANVDRFWVYSAIGDRLLKAIEKL